MRCSEIQSQLRSAAFPVLVMFGGFALTVPQLIVGVVGLTWALLLSALGLPGFEIVWQSVAQVFGTVAMIQAEMLAVIVGCCALIRLAGSFRIRTLARNLPAELITCTAEFRTTLARLIGKGQFQISFWQPSNLFAVRFPKTLPFQAGHVSGHSPRLE